MPNPSLTPQERESGITWNEADKDVEVAVYTPRWIKHLEDKLGLKPFSVDETGGGCRFYWMPKSWLRLPQRPRRGKALTESQRTRLLSALARHRGATAKGVNLSPTRNEKPPKVVGKRPGDTQGHP